MSPVNTTWWRTHPVGHRLLAVLALEVLYLAVPGRGIVALLWLAVDVWLVHRIRHSSGLAWIVLIALSALAVALGVASLVVAGFGVSALVAVVLNLAVSVLLFTRPVRGWVGRSGLMSLPGEH